MKIMKSTPVLLALAAAVVFTGYGDASDDNRRAKKRGKRSFGPGFGLAFGAAHFGSGPDFNSGRDLVTGLGHSSSLKYGPGLGLSSSPSAEEEEDLTPQPSSPSPSFGPVDRAAPRHTTTTGPVPSARDVPYPPPYVPAPYSADPYVVVAVSYGPSDPGLGPSAAGLGPSTAGLGGLYGGWPSPAYGSRGPVHGIGRRY